VFSGKGFSGEVICGNLFSERREMETGIATTLISLRKALSQEVQGVTLNM